MRMRSPHEGAVPRRAAARSPARRAPASTPLPLVFFVVAISLFPLGVGPEPQTLRDIAPGIVCLRAAGDHARSRCTRATWPTGRSSRCCSGPSGWRSWRPRRGALAVTRAGRWWSRRRWSGRGCSTCRRGPSACADARRCCWHAGAEPAGGLGPRSRWACAAAGVPARPAAVAIRTLIFGTGAVVAVEESGDCRRRRTCRCWALLLDRRCRRRWPRRRRCASPPNEGPDERLRSGSSTFAAPSVLFAGRRLIPGSGSWRRALGAGRACTSGFFVAPTDATQGDAYRIIFIHVPAAWMSMLLYLGDGLLGAVGWAFQ